MIFVLAVVKVAKRDVTAVRSLLHRHDRQVNTIDGTKELVHQDAVLGGLSTGQLETMGNG